VSDPPPGTPNLTIRDFFYRCQVFVALAACAVLLADVVVHVYRTRLTALSCWCLGRSWGLFLVQLPSGMLVWLAVGCELMGERRMSLVMYIIGLLDLQSPWVS
jgi:hypothetical protein